MALFEMTEQQAQAFRTDLVLAVRPHLPGDFIASKLGGGLPYAAIELIRALFERDPGAAAA